MSFVAAMPLRQMAGTGWMRNSLPLDAKGGKSVNVLSGQTKLEIIICHNAIIFSLAISNSLEPIFND
jgi:hypothetical protein